MSINRNPESDRVAVEIDERLLVGVNVKVMFPSALFIDEPDFSRVICSSLLIYCTWSPTINLIPGFSTTISYSDECDKKFER